MDNGIYEKVLDLTTKEEIEDREYKDLRKLDDSELPRVFSAAYEGLIRQALNGADEQKKLELIEELNNAVGLEGFDYSEGKFKELLALHSDEEEFEILRKSRPRTSISSSTLFTGFTGPSLDSELKREIKTADEIDFLVSFIKYSGLRLIMDELRDFTRTKKLRVITTSYMGASDYKAILELSKLPNTEVKISYDSNRTRLHAKAYYFKRNTGFSTAYIGSSNISNPALSSGLEWNVKLSEYTSRDVLFSISKSFESYWNDEEFKTFSPEDERDLGELKRALQPTSVGSEPFVYFNLSPYSHQREILEDLELERKEYGRYRNLVVAATGERVIIVMGAVNVMKPRVSGTLNKYILCIA
ncbi:MAG: NgoFVII family restriction endonuclease [Tissierellia bacterium]|nr:NgoFVII family restriction endonuclease [Tissierellia bacterium]